MSLRPPVVLRPFTRLRYGHPVRAGASRKRIGFRIALAVALVWAAWPTVAGALDAEHARRDLATRPPVTTAGVSTTVSTSTTVSAPPSPSSAPPVPATEATVSAPVTEAPTPAELAPAIDTPAPPPSPAPTDPPVAAASPPSLCDAAASDVLDAMNRDRAGNGVGSLCANAQLTGIAQAWADHLAQTQTFVHQDLLAVISATPFHRLAENLLVGSRILTPAQMEGAWMASPGHREHILDGRLVAAGVGSAVSAQGRVYVVVDFGGDVTA